MKIGLITDTFFPEIVGGRERYVDSLARIFGKRHDVVVFAGSYGKRLEIEHL